MLASLLPRLRSLACTTSLRCFAAEAGEDASIRLLCKSPCTLMLAQTSFIVTVRGVEMSCIGPGASKDIVRKASRGQGEVLREPYDEDSRTITVHPGQAFLGDNRSSSGLGLGDGLVSHTSKWLQVSPTC